jgi:hypothetical protein
MKARGDTMKDPKKLLEAIQARGCDATDLRDAAHEAHHALFVKLSSRWGRERIHQALLRKATRAAIAMRGLVTRPEALAATLTSYELDARAVEWLICERYRVPYETEKWLDIMWWETAKNMSIHLPAIHVLIDEVTRRKKSVFVKLYADRVEAVAKGFRQRARA